MPSTVFSESTVDVSSLLDFDAGVLLGSAVVTCCRNCTDSVGSSFLES